MSYPERFNSLRWALEEAFDPATGRAIPMPDPINVPYLTTGRLAKLTPDEKAAYKAAKAARIEWARVHWMRVVAWGGIRPPLGEYRYSARQCQTWYERIRGFSGEAP